MPAQIFSVTSLKDVRKIGFITPSSNVAVEIITTAILHQLPLVSAHFSRISVTHLGSNSVSQFTTETLASCAELIAQAPVETVLWNGTSESWTGEGYDAGVKIAEEITARTGLPSSTTSLAQMEVLRRWGMERIALATPYPDALIGKLSEYYASVGVQVVRSVGLGISVNNAIADVPRERIRQLIRDADHPDAQCIVVPCTNFPAALLVEEMEVELGKPIFDSVVVTLWKALRTIDIETPFQGWGRLMRENPVLEKLSV